MASRQLLDAAEYKMLEKIIEPFIKSKLNRLGNFPNSGTLGDEHGRFGKGGKTIHDSIWGSVSYSAWEIQLIDSPLFQRLRDIHQVGMAMYTYPTATHTRFEHSLGVTSAAKRMIEKINENSDNFRIYEPERNKIILAALLHDIGHCFYSHLSETIYGEFDEFIKLRAAFDRFLGVQPKPHEMLSFMIINSKVFIGFFKENIGYPDLISCQNDLFYEVGCMIVGKQIDDGKIKSYQTAIINGVFDADKLDYIRRDGYTAGLSIDYDIERLFTKIKVHSLSNNGRVEYRLVIDFNGITAIEELTFSKIMLFSYIYYHQKVLITESIVRDYVIGLCNINEIQSFSDFLLYTDSDILNLAKMNDKRKPFPNLSEIDLFALAQRIKNRKLPKRCFEVSQSSIQAESSDFNKELIRTYNKITEKIISNDYSMTQFMDDVNYASAQISASSVVPLMQLISDYMNITYDELLLKRKEFYDELVKVYKDKNMQIEFNMFDVHLIFPKLVSYGSANEKIILGKNNQSLLTINDFVKLDDWATSFNSNKWRGYVFINDCIDFNLAKSVAEKLILKNRAKMKNPSAYLKGVCE